MQLCRFDSDRLGLAEGDAVRDVTPGDRIAAQTQGIGRMEVEVRAAG